MDQMNQTGPKAPRICSQCGAPKPGSRCQRCRKIYDALNYQGKREEKIKSATALKHDILTWYRKLKDGNRCQAGLFGCSGGPFHFSQLDYDHIPGRGSKILEVSAMVRQGWAKDKILAEIEKCQLICANCHRYRTYMRKRGKSV